MLPIPEQNQSIRERRLLKRASLFVAWTKSLTKASIQTTFEMDDKAFCLLIQQKQAAPDPTDGKGNTTYPQLPNSTAFFLDRWKEYPVCFLDCIQEKSMGRRG